MNLATQPPVLFCGRLLIVIRKVAIIALIQLKPKNDSDYYIAYTGSSISEYLEFTAFLGNVESRYFDDKANCWCCSNVEAQKIQDQLNSKEVGSDLKLKPYGYQRQAIAFCKEVEAGIVRLPCGAGE